MLTALLFFAACIAFSRWYRETHREQIHRITQPQVLPSQQILPPPALPPVDGPPWEWRILELPSGAGYVAHLSGYGYDMEAVGWDIAQAMNLVLDRLANPLWHSGDPRFPKQWHEPYRMARVLAG